MILPAMFYVLIVNLGLLENNVAFAKDFKRLPGTSFNGTDKTAEFKSCRPDHCLDLCQERPQCNIVEWTAAENMCRFYKNSVNDTTFFRSAQTDLYIAVEHVSEWTLVFHATAGISQRITELWRAPGATNLTSWDGDPHNPAAQASSHYKSGLIDIWESLNPSGIKLMLYKDGSEVVHLNFNGKGSDKNNWFTLERYESGSFGNISTHFESMMMKTCSVFKCFNNLVLYGDFDRTFNIYLQYDGCPGDIGWMVVADSPDVCSYGNPRAGAWPAFVYSKTGKPVIFSDSTLTDSADTMAVFIKY